MALLIADHQINHFVEVAPNHLVNLTISNTAAANAAAATAPGFPSPRGTGVFGGATAEGPPSRVPAAADQKQHQQQHQQQPASAARKGSQKE